MKGMTLLETLLVIGITTLIAVSGAFGLASLQSSFTLKSAGDEIRAQLQYGRELAIAGKDGKTYSVRTDDNSVILTGDNVEVMRYQLPRGVVMTPPSFSWSFQPVTGLLSGCALPCNLGLSMRGNSEIIIIRENGIIY